MLTHIAHAPKRRVQGFSWILRCTTTAKTTGRTEATAPSILKDTTGGSRSGFGTRRADVDKEPRRNVARAGRSHAPPRRRSTSQEAATSRRPRCRFGGEPSSAKPSPAYFAQKRVDRAQ